MVYLGWIILTLTGISASVAAFLWAIRTGQFSDQGRARFLPLRDEIPAVKVSYPSRVTIEVYCLIAFAGVGALSLLATLLLVFFRLKG